MASGDSRTIGQILRRVFNVNLDAIKVDVVQTVGGGGGGGGGTEYVEDNPAAANPSGPMSMAVRADTLSVATVSADSDNIALRATSKAELYVKHADSIPVTDNGGSLTIDGNVGLSAGSNTIGKIKITDGMDDADVLDLANSNPLTVAIVDGSGDQITSFGGGTQYAEGSGAATMTGTVALMEVSGNVTAPLQGSVADGLKVDLGTNNDVTVSSSALPTGASTESTLGAMSAKLPSALGQATMANSMSVTIASNQSAIDVNTELASAGALDDSFANPTTAPVGAFLMGLKSGTSQWARIKIASDNADGLATDANGHLQSLSHNLVFNGSTWDRVRGDSTNGMLVNLGANNDVTVTSSALPTGAATEATLSTVATNSGKTPINTSGSFTFTTANSSTATTFAKPANAVGFILQATDTNTVNIRWAIGYTPTSSQGMQLQPGRDTGFIPCGADVKVIAESDSPEVSIQWVIQ